MHLNAHTNVYTEAIENNKTLTKQRNTGSWNKKKYNVYNINIRELPTAHTHIHTHTHTHRIIN